MDDALEHWMKTWEEAQGKDLFKETPKKPEINKQLYPIDFGSVNKDKTPVTLTECDAKYWKNVHKMQRVVEDKSQAPLGSEPVGKTREVPSKDSLGVKAAELGNTAQPIFPSTRGEDQRKHVTPEFADGTKLREIVAMKDNLYKLEVKLNASPKFGAFGPDAPEVKKIQATINSLKKKIDDLSNSLSPDYIEDENS